MLTAIFLIAGILGLGILFFTLHSLPERLGHKKLQFEIVAVLGLLSLFTHIHASLRLLLRRWMDEGRIARLPPHHLIFSIWALTQHYADFDVQVRAVLGPDHDPFAEAEGFLEGLFTRLLAP